MACRTGDLDTLQRLLQLDPSLATLEYFRGDADDGVDLLSITAGNGAVACLHALIDAGADPDSARNRDGAAPLHIAAETGQLTSMKLLLERGADVNDPNIGWRHARSCSQ